MNATGGVEVIQTVIQTGTYTVDVFPIGGVTTTNTYTLKEYSIGPLRFSVLQLDPIAPITTAASGTTFLFDFYNYNPPINYDLADINNFGQNNYALPISRSNIAKFSLPCLSADTCQLDSNSPTFYPNAFAANSFPDFRFRVNNVGASEHGIGFTWNEPLVLILPFA